jgi:hypothetical protein
VWSAESVQIYLGTLVVWTAGLYGFFFLFGPAVAGTVRLNWLWGVVVFYFLSAVCCQFFWRFDVCGRNFCVTYFFCWWLCSIFSRFLILKVVDFFNNLLQVVSSQSEPRGGSGTSA